MTSHSAVCTQVHPPTGVTQSVVAYLCHSRTAASSQYDRQTATTTTDNNDPTQNRRPNLVVARSTCLEIYSLRELHNSDRKLDSVCTYRLYGVIESLQVLPNRAGSGRDALLLTFRDAKVSVLQWDIDSHNLKVTSLHYFEGDESLKAGKELFPLPPMAVADPQGRCAAVVMLKNQLAILPAMESEEAILGVEEDTAGQGAIANSYVIDLDKSMKIRDVLDAVFLHGYAEPVLLLLHEVEPTWPGNLKTRKDTYALTALSLNLSAKRHPKIFSISNVPSDACRLIAAPCGGAVLFTPGLVLYYTQGHATGIVVSRHAVASPIPPPMQFNPAVELPNVTATKYGQEHAFAVSPDVVPAALSACDTTTYITLDICMAGAHAVWITSTTALCSLRSGQLALLQLSDRKSGATGRSVHISLTGMAPTASSLSIFPYYKDLASESRRIFLGSYTGDSMLLEASFSTGTGTAAEEEEEREAKRQKLGLKDNDDNVDDDDEGLSLYELDTFENNNNSSTTATTISGLKGLKCRLKVLDIFNGMGPIHTLVTGPVQSSSSNSSHPYVLACSGQGKSGALWLLRQTVVPDIITEVPLPGVLGAWAIQYIDSSKDIDSSSTKKAAVYHSYLLLSFEGSTKVLATGDELQEITDRVEFAIDTTTLTAGSVCGGRRMIQVFPQGVRVMQGDEMKQEFWAPQLGVSSGSSGGGDSTNTAATVEMDTNVSIVAGHIADPYILVVLSTGKVCVLYGDDSSSGTSSCSVKRLPSTTSISSGDGGGGVDSVVGVSACALYVDTCGWIDRRFNSAGGIRNSENSNEQKGVYCLLATTDGSLQMWKLPPVTTIDSNATQQQQLVWQCQGFGSGASLLTSSNTTTQPPASKPSTSSTTVVVELRLESFANATSTRPDLSPSSSSSGSKESNPPLCDAPVLVAVTDSNTLLVYKAVAAPVPTTAHTTTTTTTTSNRLQFTRMQIDGLPPLLSPTTTSRIITTRLVRFDGLGESLPHSGIFIAGSHPIWLVAHRASVTAHSMRLGDGMAAVGFTPFNNPSCPFGFITACRGARDCIQISMLPNRLKLHDSSWSRQKIPLKMTPTHACLYAQAQLFAVSVIRQVPYKAFLPEEDGGEPIASYSYGLLEGVAKAKGVMNIHEIRLLDPSTKFSTVWRHALFPGEQVMTVSAVQLKDITSGATVPLLAVGAGFLAGEDYPCTGRVLLFEITKAHGAAAAGMEASWSAREIYQREFKGPVTGLGTTLEGSLLLSTGNRIEVCALQSFTNTATTTNASTDDATAMLSNISYKLVRRAFYDGPLLVTALQVQPIKTSSVIMLADCHHSVQFLRYIEEGKQLKLLGRDYGKLAARCGGFCSAAGALHMVVGDGGGSIHAFVYDPKDPASGQGNRLIPWGAIHVGDKVSCMVRERMPTPAHELTLPKPPPRQAVLYGTDSGGMGLVTPLAVPAMKSTTEPYATPLTLLRTLQQELVTTLPHAAGLNPAAFRRRYAKQSLSSLGSQPFTRQLVYNTQGILDGDVLSSFIWLSVDVQQQVVRRAGLVWEEVMVALSTIYKSQLVF